MTVSNIDEDKESRENWNSHKLLLEMQNGVGSLRNSSLVSHKVLYTHKTQQSYT